MRPRFSPPSRLGARVWLHVCDVITILIIMQTIHTSFASILSGFFLFFIVLKKSEMRKVFLKCPPKSVKFQEKDEIPLNYVVHSSPQISGGLSLIGQSKQ